jgi:hypothetical protein
LGHIEEVKVSYLDDIKPVQTGMRRAIMDNIGPALKVFNTEVHMDRDIMHCQNEYMVELRYCNKFYVRPEDTEALDVMVQQCVREIREALYEEIVPHCLHLERAIYEENIPEARTTIRKIMDKVLY